MINTEYNMLIEGKNKFFDISFDESQSYYHSCKGETDQQSRLDCKTRNSYSSKIDSPENQKGYGYELGYQEHNGIIENN